MRPNEAGRPLVRGATGPEALYSACFASLPIGWHALAPPPPLLARLVRAGRLFFDARLGLRPCTVQ
eukprot:14640161-Alexandrium_andersonii.AAC.1